MKGEDFHHTLGPIVSGPGIDELAGSEAFPVRLSSSEFLRSYLRPTGRGERVQARDLEALEPCCRSG